MSGVAKRSSVLGGLGIASIGLTLLAVASWSLSEPVTADFPQRPVWDLGAAGPWVGAYARAIAAGSWTAARVCLVVVALVLALRGASLLVDAVRKVVRRSNRSAS
ncbi:hypothetical protein AB0L74_27210 [Streptomyces sp. NPDC052020]|uniref:hypothetical protein n=1 Tax=Streptomyces sp. NPDC052020 TaxID=3155677 RepID=UPI003435C684